MSRVLLVRLLFTARATLLTMALALHCASIAHAACSDTSASDGTACDDGRACTTGDVCRGGTCVGTPGDALCGLDLPTFLCFRARAPRQPDIQLVSPAFRPRRNERLVDEFGTNQTNDRHAVDVKRSVAFCAAASGTIGLAQNLHLQSYGARQSKTRPPQPRATKRRVSIDTPLGSLSVTLRRPRRVLAPANAAHDGLLPDGGRRHRRAKCYGASAKVPLPPAVDVADPVHGIARRVRPRRITRLCAQEIRGTAAAPSPRTGFVACFAATLTRETPRQARPQRVVISARTDFGAERLELGRVTELCVPAVAAVATVPATQPFAFLAGSGPVDVALATVWLEARTAPQDAEAATAAAGRVAEATTVLQQNLVEARTKLAAAVCGVDPNALHDLVSLGPLLRLLGDDPAILACLRDLAVAEPAASAAARRPGLHDDATSDDELVRRFAAGQIAATARQHSATARELLLDLAGGRDPSVVRIAVRAKYQVLPNRRLAQRALRARVRPELRHVLYVE